jgi:hypothetical protein
MSLTVNSTDKVFNQEVIKKGDLIRAKYSGWSGWMNGIVCEVQPDKITVVFLQNIGNAMNYYRIYANEVDSGLWEILWTTDLMTIHDEGMADSNGGNN